MGYTQQEISEKLGLERSSIAKYESGTAVPSIKALPKICKALNLTYEEILNEFE